MSFFNIYKDSHFALVKGYSLVRSIEDTVGDVESPYVVPGKELSEAQALLHSDFSACNKHLKKALSLYQQEVPLARRYNTVRERVVSAEDQDLRTKNSQYVEFIRAGRYKDAGKVLDDIMKMDIPQIVNHLSAIVSETQDSVVLLNRSSAIISITSVSVVEETSTYGGGYRGNIRPGDSVSIALNQKVKNSVEVRVTYFVNGKQYKRNLNVGI